MSHPRTIQLTIGNQTLTISNWAKVTGISRKTIYERTRAGWTPLQATGREAPPWKTWHLGPKPRKNKLTEFSRLEAATVTVVAIDNVATGRRMREIRQMAGLSMDQAAEALGWTSNQIFKLEKGRVKWRQKHIDHVNKVAKGWVENASELHDVQASDA